MSYTADQIREMGKTGDWKPCADKGHLPCHCPDHRDVMLMQAADTEEALAKHCAEVEQEILWSYSETLKQYRHKMRKSGLWRDPVPQERP